MARSLPLDDITVEMLNRQPQSAIHPSEKAVPSSPTAAVVPSSPPVVPSSPLVVPPSPLVAPSSSPSVPVSSVSPVTSPIAVTDKCSFMDDLFKELEERPFTKKEKMDKLLENQKLILSNQKLILTLLIPSRTQESSQIISGGDICNVDNFQEGWVGEQQVWEGLDKEDRLLPDIVKIKGESCSAGNFAVKVVQFMFSPEELKDQNCMGRRGKDALNAHKLGRVKSYVHQMYPVPTSKIDVQWKKCIISIDEFFRRKKRKVNAS